MPCLVHQKKGSSRYWEVAWSWAPNFLAADLSLVSYVDKVLSEEFQGVEIPSLTEEPFEETRSRVALQMHRRVLDLILERYSIKGLREYLNAVLQVDPETKA